MALSHKDRVKQAVTTGGTGALVIGSASSGYQALGAGDDGKLFPYVIEDGTAWETGYGTYTHSGTSFARTTRKDSSTGAALDVTTSAFVMVAWVAAAASDIEPVKWTYDVDVAGTFDAAIAAAVNTFYVRDISGFTADRTLTLPATAAVGDRVAIKIETGDASFELLITANTGDTLDSVAGGTEWSRVFITGEVVVMRCVEASATWIVEVDGRIPSMARLERSTAQSINDNTSTKILLDNELFDVGGIGDPTTDNQVVVRRAGKYILTALGRMATGAAATKVVQVVISAGGANAAVQNQYSAVTGAILVPFPTITSSLAAGDVVSISMLHDFGSATNTSTSLGFRPTLIVVEVL